MLLSMKQQKNKSSKTFDYEILIIIIIMKNHFSTTKKVNRLIVFSLTQAKPRENFSFIVLRMNKIHCSLSGVSLTPIPQRNRSNISYQSTIRGVSKIDILYCSLFINVAINHEETRSLQVNKYCTMHIEQLLSVLCGFIQLPTIIWDTDTSGISIS